VTVDLWAWGAFVGFILFLLALDLFLFHREAHEISIREATVWSVIWIALGLAFGAVIWAWQGGEAAGEYLAGYLIEKSLSVDNIFVFAVLFSYFAVPAAYQHRVLFWGVLGAIVFRAIFIAAGVTLLNLFHGVIYVFGGFLVLTGLKMALLRDEEVHPEQNPALRALRRVLPITAQYHGQRFLTRVEGQLFATPLLAVLVVVETTDIVFAIDSIPAILAITRDPFLVFSSNAFAILGLRALYFVLAGMMQRFVYLKPGLGVLLVFVGGKMLLSDVYKLPIWLSLALIATIVGVSIVASLLASRRPAVARPTPLPARDPPGPGVPPAAAEARAAVPTPDGTAHPAPARPRPEG
jgi:tellurite resistance protein TerC